MSADERLPEGPISDFPELARHEARQSFHGLLSDVEHCHVVADSALTDPADPRARRVRFAGPTLTVTVTCSDGRVPRLDELVITDSSSGDPSGRCRVTVLGEGRLEPVAHAVTGEDGCVRLMIPDQVVSLLVTRADDAVGQTAWLRF